MEWNKDNLDNIVLFINKELQDGKAMKVIELEEFGANERVIHKRLIRAGYKKVNNLYSKCYTDTIQKPKTKKEKCYTGAIQNENKENSTRYTSTIQKAQKEPQRNLIGNIDIEAIKELTTLIEPIKEVIEAYKENKIKETAIEIEPIEIKIDKSIGATGKAIGVRIDPGVYEEWTNFTKKYNRNFKTHQLLSQALIEFMKKYD